MKFLNRYFSQNIIVQYSTMMAVMIIMLAAIMGQILTRRITDYIINAHIEQYPQMVSLVTKNDKQTIAFFRAAGKGHSLAESESLFQKFLDVGSVFRVKVWDINGIVIWSDRTDIIGQDFSSNTHFLKALSGVADYDLAEPHHDEDDKSKPENITEQTKEKILEIYIPVFYDDKVIGVLELYEADEELYTEIQENIAFVWFIIGGSGMLLYGLQFFIFYKSHQKQQLVHEHLEQTQHVTLSALANLAETRDNETGRHLDRTARYVKKLAESLQKRVEHETYLTDEYIRHLVISAPLHDIGKVGVPDQILQKPGKLTDAEFDEMKNHCVYGADTLIAAEKKLTFRSFLKIAVQLTSSHHERWDGQGYPAGLKETDIPFSARIMALADVYDALRTKRVYKEAFSHQKSKRIIIEESGHHFDPSVVAVFLEQEQEFERISNELADA